MRQTSVAVVAALVALTCATHGGHLAAADVPQLQPPSKRVYMITDSVGLGSEKAMAAAFAGWDFTLDGDAGEFTETLESKYVRPRITQTPDVFGDYAIVAAGYNYPYWDPERFDHSIDTMVATLLEAGVKHVLWVTLREVKQQYVTPGAWHQIQPYYWYFPTVNDHLERALLRHPQLSLVDWAAVADQSGLTYDAIHLNTAGSALYSAIAKQAVIDATTAVPDDSVTRVHVPDAAGGAVALNLTTVSPRTLGFLTAYDCDHPQPTVSNHNHWRDLVVAHAAIVPVGASGDVCIYAKAATNLVVDITGRFAPGAGIVDTTSTRLVDTRERGFPQPPLTPLVVDAGMPGGPMVLNVTAVDAEGPGWLRAAPCSSVGGESTESTSTVNFTGPAAVPNVAVVVPGDDGTVCITSSITTHVLVDRYMSFAPTSGVDVVAPHRVLDTRDGAGARLDAGGVAVLDADAVGLTDDATGVMLNLTVADPLAPGYLTAYPCLAGRPDTSNLNYGAGDVVSNFVIVEPDADGDVCLYSHAATHVVVDALGTVSTGFAGGAPQRLLDTRLANLPPAWP